MKRNLTPMSATLYDVLVIGGGICGSCVAYEAARRGLSVALVEKEDFGAATSANSLKIIHGGFRYLQHVDIKRLRVSSGERSRLMALAPHLVHPLPVILPIYGYGLRGREAYSLAVTVNELLTLDRNRHADPGKNIPRGRIISRQECITSLPDIPTSSLRGAVVFHDAQVHNPERLVLAFLQSAIQNGAHVANYVEATSLLRHDNHIIGANVRDRLGEELFSIRAKMVVNAAGPWVERFLMKAGGQRKKQKLAKAFNLITRPLFNDHAVGLPGQEKRTGHKRNVKRFFFFAPWRGRSMIGTDYVPYNGDPEHVCIHESEILNFLGAINETYPAANLRRDDIHFVHGGLVPIDDAHPLRGVRLSKQDRIDDHRSDGVSGLISVVATKYTTSRAIGEHVARRIAAELDQGVSEVKRSLSGARLYGGDIDDFSHYLQTAIDNRPRSIDAAAMEHLVYTYGSAHNRVANYLDAEQIASHSAREQDATPRAAMLRAETVHAVRQEMAQTLEDVIFRRTDLGTAGYPGDGTILCCAEAMAGELGWTSTRMRKEMEAVNNHFKLHHAVEPHITLSFTRQETDESTHEHNLAAATL